MTLELLCRWFGLRGATALLLLCAAAAAPALPVRVGTYQNPPKIAQAPGAAPEGIFIDVIESVARAEGWTLTYVPGTFAEGLARLARGEIDLMPDVAATPARRELFDFHAEPVLHGFSQVYARRGEGVRSILDLSGRRVVVLDGSVQQQFFRQMAAGFGVEVELILAPDYAAAFRLVSSGAADAVVSNPLYGARHAARAGLEDTAVVFSPSTAFFAARKGAPPQWLAAIDRALVAQKKDPRSPYFVSLARWTPRHGGAVLPAWLPWAGLAAAAALLAGGTWAWSLRRAAQRLRASEGRQRLLVAELQASTAQLQRAHADLQTFSQSVSHDLRAPVSAIGGFVGKVLEDEAGKLGERSLARLQRVRAAAGRMDQLIEDLLRLASISGETLRREPVDLHALAREVLDGLCAAAPERHVRVHVEPGLRVDADPRLLRVALENLLGNAWKFTAGAPGAAITVGREAGDDGEVFYVRDNGAGFDMDYADKLFAPFQRLHDQAEFAGNGIGLSIVQRVVAHHGGRIWAEGRPGAGALFRFTLG